MKPRSLQLIVICLASVLLGASCSSTSKLTNKPFNTPAQRATNKKNIKVSLKHRMVYVKEGNKTLLATPTAVGTAKNPTRTGNFRTFNRLPRKRSNTYGFHSGSVWPTPRSHGCLRLHKNVAPTFFDIVGAGVPVNIAYTQPENATVGKNVRRPTDYADPDPPANVITASNYFNTQPSTPTYVS